MIPKGYRLVMRCVQPGEEYVEPSSLYKPEIERNRWHLSSPSTFDLPVLEPITPPKPQLLVLVWEIREYPEMDPSYGIADMNVITPELAKALLQIGHTGKIIEAP